MSGVWGSCTTVGQATYLLLKKLASEPHPRESVHFLEQPSDTSVALPSAPLSQGSAALAHGSSAAVTSGSASLSQVDYYGYQSSKNSTAWIGTIDGH